MSFTIKIVASAICLLITSLNLFAQNQDLQNFSRQLVAFYQQGKFDEAIPLAEKIVEIQRQNKSKSSQNLINALENLAQIRAARFKASKNKLTDNNLAKDQAKKIFEKIDDDGAAIEMHLREAVTLSDKESKKDLIQAVGMRNSLAWILYNFSPPSPELVIGVTKLEHDKYEDLTKVKVQKRFGDAKEIYSKALNESESNFGEADEATLVTLLNFAEFSVMAGDFEKAVSLYEKCIKAVEKKYGSEDRNLIIPLRQYAQLLVTSNQTELANKASERIQKITGKPENISGGFLNLSLRSDKAFAVNNVPEIEEKGQSNEALVSLGRRGANINSGYDGILASSSQGKTFYDNYKRLSLLSVGVKVTVDETGKVIEAEAVAKDKSLKKAAEKIVRNWTFKPFKYDGQNQKMTGYVECLFISN